MGKRSQSRKRQEYVTGSDGKPVVPVTGQYVVLAPANTSIPTLAGALPPQVAQTTTCNPGVWTGAYARAAYQWQKGGVDIAGARSPSYVPVAGDIGGFLRCGVKVSNPIGASAFVYSAASAAVIP